MIFKYRVQNHTELKEDVLNIIETMKAHYDLTEPKDFSTKSTSPDAYRSPGHISYADYFNEKFKKNVLYRDLIQSSMDPYVEDVCKSIYCNSWNYKGMWYHEYHEGDSFSWHTHQNSHMTGLYYLIGNDPTELITGESPEIEEGDVVFFPSFIPHRAPVAKEKRCIIAWTLNFHFKEL
jgi:hypothetical protein